MVITAQPRGGKPGATTTVAAAGGAGGGLPVTGSNAGVVAGIGGALLVLGGVGYLLGRRRRSRFVA
jgi:LPXTG-motif cell wall-anchored protein